ncbi:MAG: GWxTD domain-containing protein [Bacteroidales bacterium]|nr:GWxTD domain-containing protein [Bacteroidales bacterium]
MKRILLSAVMAVALLAPMSLRAQMQALFGYSTFYLPEQDRPYMETYLQFDAWTMQFEKQSNGVYRATVEVTLVARQQDSVCYVKKYDLASPTVASLDELDFSFIDVQRFSLTNGVYDIEVTLRDKGTDAPAAQVLEKVVVSYDRTHPAMSSVQPMAEVHPTQGEGNILSRNGYDMEPYVNDFYPEQVEELNYYYEVYNIDKEIGRKPFLAMAYVERQETGARYEDVQMMSRKNSAPLVPVYGSLDISKLPSGNYNLVVELRNRDGETMLYKRVPFYRSNPGVKGKELSDFATTFAGKYTDEEQLNIYIDGLYPIASEAEKQVAQELVKRPGLEEKQAFLYRFWTERNAMAAEAEWLKYKERIDYVQEHFSYPRTPGIHTDFGRVYLQYGPPDFIRDEKNYVSANRIGSHNEQPFETMQLGEDQNATDPLAGTSQGHVHYLPYQFWRYNKLDTDDPNRVFLFWDEHRSGYYRLLNSNARGEVQEIGWERRLCRQQLPEGVLGEVGEQFNRGY